MVARARTAHRAWQALWLVALLLALAAAAPLVRFALQPGEQHVSVAQEAFFKGNTVVAGAVVARNGFQASEEGWYLEPRAAGSLVYRIRKAAEPGLFIQVSTDMGALGVTGRLRARFDDGQWQTLAENRSLELGDRIDLPLGRNAMKVDLEFTATNSRSGSILLIRQLWWA